MKLNIDTNIPTRAEEKKQGYDELPDELLKGDIDKAMEVLSVLFEIIWEKRKYEELLAKLLKRETYQIATIGEA